MFLELCFKSVIPCLLITHFLLPVSFFSYLYIKPINDGGSHSFKKVLVAKITVKVDSAFI